VISYFEFISIHFSINPALTAADPSVKAFIQQSAPGDRSRCDRTAHRMLIIPDADFPERVGIQAETL
jgi:hypothetical protein